MCTSWDLPIFTPRSSRSSAQKFYYNIPDFDIEFIENDGNSAIDEPSDFLERYEQEKRFILPVQNCTNCENLIWRIQATKNQIPGEK